MAARELPGAPKEGLPWRWGRRPNHIYLARAREERTAEMRGGTECRAAEKPDLVMLMEG